MIQNFIDVLIHAVKILLQKHYVLQNAPVKAKDAKTNAKPLQQSLMTEPKQEENYHYAC